MKQEGTGKQEGVGAWLDEQRDAVKLEGFESAELDYENSGMMRNAEGVAVKVEYESDEEL
ncbi:predicted protein [Pyrenophora tritici-repentis Pt-1C-BFP]|uniref:Uncharacterized protein n=1 Tax=Pyrenophora tritici-repentis (strain Pt-1C-BFP) TaxID=426418 RepID=B2VUW6_PYRTR|nr:uncharacterized protein PTRG_01103 [Pyrenophora tritici-repentis Pt-1C-BFP]EDU40541.1 predicted protein [Pyrenophora tritici-repentis Pt-1C-BFP]